MKPSGQLLLSKLPLRSAWTYHFARHSSKRALFGRVQIGGCDVAIACVHLISDYAANCVQRRLSQLQDVFLQLRDCSDCLMLGDFNFGDLGEETQLVHWGRYIDVWRTLQPLAPGFTFDPATNPLADLTSRNKQPRRLDRILMQSDVLTPTDVSIVGTNYRTITVPAAGPSPASLGLPAPAASSGRRGCEGTDGAGPRDPAPPECGSTSSSAGAGDAPAVEGPERAPVGAGPDYEAVHDPDDEAEGAGPTEDFRLHASDHYAVLCTVAVAAAVPAPLPDNVPLSHQTAVVVIPPAELWPPLQDIRRHHDKAYTRWPPHFNVLHPFIAEEVLELHCPRIALALAHLPPFSVSLAQVDAFDDRRGYLWFGPGSLEEQRGMCRLHGLLASQFPFCRREGYTPHLTVGQFGPSDIIHHRKEINRRWRPVRFTVDRVHVLAKPAGHGPYRVVYSVPLGQGPPGDVPQWEPATFPDWGPGTGAAEEEEEAEEEEPPVPCGSGSGTPFACPPDADAMVLDRPAVGARKLTPYAPRDALERWMLRHTRRGLARAAPTHVSQLGAMYHIPSALVDGYLEHWAQSVRDSDATPFFMEEVRGDVFRLYLDLDLKWTSAGLFDLLPSGLLFLVLAHTRAFCSLWDRAPPVAVVTECQGPWSDERHRDAVYKSGFRVFFQGLFVDCALYKAYLQTLGATLEHAARRPERACAGQGWADICDMGAVSWDRGRLMGTVKRRRSLQRQYRYMGAFSLGAVADAAIRSWADCPLAELAERTEALLGPWGLYEGPPGVVIDTALHEQLQSSLLHVLHATTLRVWDSPTVCPAEAQAFMLHADVDQSYAARRGGLEL